LWTTEQKNANNEYAAFSFCQKLSSSPDDLSSTKIQEPNSGMLYCDDTENYEYYAVVANPQAVG